MTHESPNPAQINVASKMPEGAASRHMAQVLEAVSRNQDLQPEAAQGVLADHLIGATLRVMGSEYGLGALYTMGEERPMTSATAKVGAGETHWLQRFTGGEGLRRAVIDVDTNPAAGNILNDAIRRLRIDRSGEKQAPIMTTMDQITGYLDTEVAAEREIAGTEKASPWKETIKQELTDYLENPHDVKGRWALSDHASPDAADVMRDARNTWSRAVEIAKKAGVDIDLLTRSVEWMKAHQSDPVHQAAIGKTALVGTAPNYEHLFE